MRLRSFRWFALLSLVLLPATVAGEHGGYQILPYAWGLESPRGLTIDGEGNLVATLAGSGDGYMDARIVRFQDLNGDGMADNGAEQQDLVNGLPTSSFAPFGEGARFATSDAQVTPDGEIYFVTNILVADWESTGWSALWSTAAPHVGGNPLSIASPYAHFVPYEIAHNPDGEEYDSNPYALVLDAERNAYVTDAAANAVYHVTPTGDITTYAVFADLVNPPGSAQATSDLVPTGIVWGPDGALYMGSESGYPWVEGVSNVWRLADDNGDGDAMDAGEVTAYATGLTTVTDIAFDHEGRLLAAEFRGILTGQPAESGRVVRWNADSESWDVLADGLTTPTGITVGPDSTIYVTQEYLGQIVQLRHP